ncbi:hypothetical protein E1301_Tti013462 [Triplophysa tibetana]|uniref:Uncharacterized protein n=1 Tax=Triplophysa tibetana TaxID=1572043 RepID=A0A5A9NU83_9TELE|nr:hypothetical protein E1301_Tti013462 [Triplophysa tibetana]
MQKRKRQEKIGSFFKRNPERKLLEASVSERAQEGSEGVCEVVARIQEDRDEEGQKGRHVADRQEADRQEADRHKAGRHEAGRHEAGRHEAGRHEAGRQETDRQEAGRQEADRQEAGRQEEQSEGEVREDKDEDEMVERRAENSDVAVTRHQMCETLHLTPIASPRVRIPPQRFTALRSLLLSASFVPFMRSSLKPENETRVDLQEEERKQRRQDGHFLNPAME